MAKLPEDVSVAIALAEKAGWPVSARNGKIVITAPDGTALTVGAQPNDESLKVWRSNCRRYNLIENGPAMTPKQQEEMAMATATAPKISAEEEKKVAEASEARKKAALATVGQGPTPGAPKAPSKAVSVPVVKFSAPSTPVVTPKVITTALAKKKAAPAVPAVDTDGFPPFTQSMLVIEPGSYSDFQIKSGKHQGKYFCGMCWERGDKETFKAPQGLASHRGFRHAAFTSPSPDEANLVKLPIAIETAMELLRGALVEELTDLADASQVSDLEKKVEELTGLLKERDASIQEKDDKFAQRGKMLTELEAKLREVVKDRDAAIKVSTERGAALDRNKAESEEQIRMLVAKLEKDFGQMQRWANELAPVKAVGQIMDLVEKYLTK